MTEAREIREMLEDLQERLTRLKEGL